MSREFKLDDSSFQFLQKLAYEHTGIVLGDHKKEMMSSRLNRRLRTLNLPNYTAYCHYIRDNLEQELSDFVNSITTNLTSFFRESHHFDFLTQQGIPEIIERHKADRRVRIWSAGCSTGMEPYSISFTTKSLMPDSWDYKILATDLDSNVLAKGRSGIYSDSDIGNLEPEKIKKYFKVDSSRKQFLVKPDYQKLIHFKQLNLMKSWPFSGKFDIIFCRNVVIYFDKETRKKLLDRYADLLVDNGVLIMGHSESLQGLSSRFKAVGRTIFRKTM